MREYKVMIFYFTDITGNIPSNARNIPDAGYPDVYKFGRPSGWGCDRAGKGVGLWVRMVQRDGAGCSVDLLFDLHPFLGGKVLYSMHIAGVIGDLLLQIELVVRTGIEGTVESDIFALEGWHLKPPGDIMRSIL
jgi:hypothetical protein